MVLLTGDVYQLARDAGLSKSAAVTATAIAIEETNLDPGAVGDTALVTSKWGPSIGLWQIRSLRAETGTGRPRDASRLKDPTFNARAMVAISNGGTNWTPWSVYNSGAYKRHEIVIRSLAENRGPTAPKPRRDAPATATPVFDVDPFPGGSGIPGYGDDALGKLLPESLGIDLEKALYVGTAVALGVVLIAIGAWRASA